MTFYAARSTTGSDANTGADWSNAEATMAGLIADLAAGDTGVLSQNHAETFSSATQTWTLPAHARLIGADDSAWPPTARAARPTFTTTLTYGITVVGDAVLDNLNFVIGSGANAANLAMVTSAAKGSQIYRGCRFQAASTGVGGLAVGSSTLVRGGQVRHENCVYRFAGSQNRINVAKGRLDIVGGSFESGSSTPSYLVNLGATSLGNAECNISGLDMSALGTGLVIFNGANNAACRGTIRGSIFPSGWTGNLTTGTLDPGMRYELHDCIAGSTKMLLKVRDYSGTIDDTRVNVRTGGANDGAGYALKCVTNANAGQAAPLRTPELLAKKITSVGSPLTLTVKIMGDDAAALTNADLAVILEYRGTSGSPALANISSAADLLATPATLAASSDTWVETGVTNPQKRELSVTFTPQEPGYLLAHVAIAKPSATLYVCPVLTGV